jgi:3-dehydroquinate dehydratase type I
MICLSILKRTNEEALALMERYTGLCDIVELRLDSMVNPDLKKLCVSRRCPVIATNRKKDEGGCFEGTESARVALLCEAVERGVDYVDIELRTGKKDAHARTKKRTQLIVSYHDIEGTPSLRRLRTIASQCRARGADMVKIVTRARVIEDTISILQLLHHARATQTPMAAFCMGPEGRLSRIAAPLFGSRISYVAAGEADETAPGQFTIREMNTVMEILRRRT